MTRTLACAAALLAGALAVPQDALAAKGFKGGFKPVPFRAHGLFGPVTPKTLSHSGLPAKFHGHFHKGPHQHAHGHPHGHHRFHRPLIVSLAAGGVSVIYPGIFYDAPPGDLPAPPALIPVGAPAGGCKIEDVAVSGGRTVSIIRC